MPVTDDVLYADIFAQWGAPAVIVAATRLGTINHSLLTIEALRARKVSILGVAFVGEPEPDSEATVCAIGKVARLGRLPRLASLTPQSLGDAFAANFETGQFL